MLTKLPVEIIDMVAQSLTNKSDLKSLALVCRTVHHAVQRVLWNSLDLSPSMEDELWNFKPKQIFDKNLPTFKYTTEINFNSTFREKHGERCPHYRDQESTFDCEGGANSRFNCLTRTAESIVEIIPAGRLQTFTWGLGTCLPKSLLGRQGILARQQSQIRSLSLTTAGDCMIWDEIDLSAFCQLKSLCWKGPRHDNLDPIAVAIRNNRESLSHLELDFVDWPRLRDQISGLDADSTAAVCKDFFGKVILSMDDVLPEKPLFSAIVSLSLSSVPLQGRTVHAFDLQTLQSLTLRNCPGWHLFLAEIAHLESPLYLKTFEMYHLRSRDEQVSAAEHDALHRFIRSFEGLEDLFLSLERSLNTLELWNKVVKHHGATLTRFVHHQRSPNGGGRTGNVIFEDVDLPDFNLGPKLSLVNKGNPLRGLVSLESIGISCLPEILGPMFASFAQQATPSSVQLIHIRQSRKQRNQWGSWVTGGSLPKILQQNEAGELATGAREAGYYWAALNNTRYATPASTDPAADELPEVDSEEEARRMESPRHRYVFSQPTTSPKRTLLPLDKRVILRDPLRRFADWVFGPRGLPGLRVIALGDFAHGRVIKEKDNMFLVRGNGGPSAANGTDSYTIFWPEEKGTQDWAELVDRNRHFLEACPAEPLMDYDTI